MVGIVEGTRREVGGGGTRRKGGGGDHNVGQCPSSMQVLSTRHLSWVSLATWAQHVSYIPKPSVWAQVTQELRRVLPFSIFSRQNELLHSME